MEMIQVAYAKTHLSALLGRVEQGEELAIAKRGKIIAKLVPASLPARSAAQAFEQALDALRRSGARVTPIAVPEFSQLADINAGGGFTAAEAWAWHETLLQTRAAEYDPRVASRMHRGEGFLAKDFLLLQQQRKHWQQAVAQRTHQFDALLMPTVPMIAPCIEALQASDDAYFAANAAMLRNPTFINFLDGCAISLPCQTPGRAPVGLSVAGVAMRDEAVAQWALAIEAALHKNR